MHTKDHIGRLPALERDVLRLHMDLRKPQTEIAKILGLSQPSVNYRYKRARERLDFMEKIPQVTSSEIREVLTRLGASDLDIQAMVLYVETNSQSEVARRMETSQGAVRHWIHRVLVHHLQNDLREDDVHRRVRTACGMLVNKPGIFSESQRAADNPKPRKVEQTLPAAPRIRGSIATGQRVQITDGLYAEMWATVLAADDTVLVRLDLESQEITLRWAP